MNLDDYFQRIERTAEDLCTLIETRTASPIPRAFISAAVRLVRHNASCGLHVRNVSNFRGVSEPAGTSQNLKSERVNGTRKKLPRYYDREFGDE